MGLKSPIPLKQMKFNVPVPCKLHVDRELLVQTKQKLALARFPEEQTDFGEENWAQGAKVSRVKQLAEFWKDQCQWEDMRDQSGYWKCRRRGRTLLALHLVILLSGCWRGLWRRCMTGAMCTRHADIITLVMMRWIQGATPGLRFYREAFGRGMREAEKTFETYVSAPTGVSMYAKEQLHASTLAAQAANIQYWQEHEKGGHFSSLKRPDLFVADLRAFFSSPVVLKALYRK